MPLKLIIANKAYSSWSFRPWILLAHFHIPFEEVVIPMDHPDTRARMLEHSPTGKMPALRDGAVETWESLAILEYLEETRPTPALLPKDAAARARVRALAHMVALEIHPINNLRVLEDLKTRVGADDAGAAGWFRHWVGETFGALETRLARDPQTGRFCHGDTPTLADICLVPQVINNTRYNVDMTPYPTISRINAACLELDAFKKALPANQPDAE